MKIKYVRAKQRMFRLMMKRLDLMRRKRGMDPMEYDAEADALGREMYEVNEEMENTAGRSLPVKTGGNTAGRSLPIKTAAQRPPVKTGEIPRRCGTPVTTQERKTK